MPRRRALSSRWLGYASTILLGACAVASSVIGQSTPTQLPADCSAYASVPLPAEAKDVPVPKVFPACASYRSYRGIGRPVNFSEARTCAWRERLAQEAHLRQNPKEPTAWVVGGSLILADIYFNGAGVERNVPLAMHFACEFEEGTAMLALPDIVKLNGSLPSGKRFEFCDYAATTFTMNFCSGYESEISDDRRNRYYDSLRKSMTSDQRVAFEKLLAAKDEYIQAHANEVDQGGTIRDIRTLGSQSILEDLFRTDIVHFERKKWPALSSAQIATADSVLESEYEDKLQQLRGETAEQLQEGAVSASNLSRVEAIWEKYRDAWVAFARLRYPSHQGQIRAQVTLDRLRYVKTIYSY